MSGAANPPEGIYIGKEQKVAERSVKVTFRANVAEFKAALRSVSSSLEDVVAKTGKNAQVASTGIGRMVQSMEYQRSAWMSAGAVFTAAGATLAGGFVAATKAAIDWESAFTGVRKTVDGSEADYAQLNGQLRELARTLPASHEQIAQVAEAAGQLGIKKENIVAFTKTMIDMGESTNLSAGEAATTLARFANIMGTAQSRFPNLGSSIVALGNNFATTEREIADMGMRLASAGRQAGLTEGDVLGIATALSSVGIEAEAGGTAFSRVMTEMRTAVDTGNDKLKVFAQTAGMSAEQFKKMFSENAGQAITRFVQGLGKMQKSGESIQPILQDLQFTDVRIGNALRSSASAADLFTKAMQMGNSEFSKGTALGSEAAKRYETTASQLKILKNNLYDIGIGIGSYIVPALNTLVGGVTAVAGAFDFLPGPVKAAMGYFMGIGGVLSLAGGGFLLLAPRIMEGVQAFRALKAADIPFISKAIVQFGTATKLTLAGTGIGLAVLALTAAFSALGGESRKVQAIQDELSGTLDKTTGAMTAQSRAALANDEEMQKAAAAYKKAGGSIQDFWRAAMGDETAKKRVDALTDSIWGATRQIASQNNIVAGAIEQSTPWVDALDRVSEAHKEEKEKVLAAKEGIEAMGGSTEQAADSTGQLGEASGQTSDALQKVGDSAADSQKELDNYFDSLKKIADVNISADQAAMKYAETLEKVTAALHAGAGASAEGTKAQRENRQSLIDLANAGLDEIDKLYKQGGATDTLAAKTRSIAVDFVNTAVKMGLTGDQAVDTARKYGLIPSDVRTQADFDAWKALSDADILKRKLGQLNGMHTYSTHTQTIYQNYVEAYNAGRVPKGIRVPAPSFATGGLIHGPGTSTSDSIPAWLSKGEYVIKAAAVSKYGEKFMHMVNSMRLPVGKYATGGPVAAHSLGSPTVKVSAPRLDGAVIQGKLELGADGFFSLVDGRINSHAGVRAADAFVANRRRYEQMKGY